MRTRLPAALALTLALGIGGVADATPAAAVVGVELTGYGYGHGHGMSQYGARGRASAGHTVAQILDAYYPGTTTTVGSDTSTIRVWIQGDTDGETTVLAEAGLTLSAGGDTVALPTGSATAWRLRASGAVLVLEAQVGGSWVDPALPAAVAALTGVSAAAFAAADGTVRLTYGSTRRDYRGTATATLVGSPTVLRTVVTSSMRDYLRSVVPSEMPSSWPAVALQAQAVAARTYAMWDATSGSTWYDTCDTTQCQVYSGVADLAADGTVLVSHDYATTTAAVDATAGMHRTLAGVPIFAQFSASNGGYSSAGSQPYLRAAPDPYDTYPSWTVLLSAAGLSAAYPAIGSFVSLTVLERDGFGAFGGRVTSLRLTGSRGSVVVTGDAFRSAMGLKSTLWSPTRVFQPIVSPQRDWNGDTGADLIGRAPTGRLYFYAGRPNAAWSSAVQIGKGWAAMVLMTQTHDLYATGKPEMLTVTADGLLHLYQGNGTGGWGPVATVGKGWSTFDRLIGVDGFHGAGVPGLLGRRADTGEVFSYVRNGRGGLALAGSLGTGWDTYDVILGAGDWDGDGTGDLVARDASSGALMLLRGDGAGHVTATTQIGRGWSGMEDLVGGADWDRDGWYDLIARDDDTGLLYLYPGDGAGGFLTPRVVGHGWVGFTLVS